MVLDLYITLQPTPHIPQKQCVQQYYRSDQHLPPSGVQVQTSQVTVKEYTGVWVWRLPKIHLRTQPIQSANKWKLQWL